ncbi:hypothetical protein R3W88_001308 [Solanum pinnatisectum]|uniref:Uncharacterized protein n=1 Tax=Solanum pinnatisectum TaxID=50273 RepID=A0AAV9MIN0_9SOLN|nr:hypothetical protein R3W88_001308 [Solanum pinnatisectum]
MDFSDRDAPYPCLEIMENKQHSRAKVLTLKVHPPVIGAFPLVRKTLDISLHLPEWSLFQQVNVHNLHNMAMLQGKELHIDDSGKLSTSWSDFLIGLRSSFVTLRLDNELIVEPYSPHRCSRQFGYCQDVPGALIEHHYDGSLLVLVQLWDSCVHLGSSLKIIIPMCPSNKGS